MSVQTASTPDHTGTVGAARERLGAAKDSLKREAFHQLATAAASDGFADHISTQLDEAKRLSRAAPEDPYLTEAECERRRRKRDRGLVSRAGQNVDLVGLAIALVVVGVVMYVGLNVMSTTEQSTELDSGSEFQNASNDLTGGIADAYSLSGILFLVLILTGVVGLLLGLRARRQ